MRVAVVGQGYVGLTGAVALTLHGHEVVGSERDAGRLRRLCAGEAPVFEPGLPEQLSAALTTGRLRFAGPLADSHQRNPFDVVLITVGTPPGRDGGADLSQVTAALAQALALRPPAQVIMKSTVPPGTSSMLAENFPSLRERYAYNPEFLNQGSALEDGPRRPGSSPACGVATPCGC